MITCTRFVTFAIFDFFTGSSATIIFCCKINITNIFVPIDTFMCKFVHGPFIMIIQLSHAL